MLQNDQTNIVISYLFFFYEFRLFRQIVNTVQISFIVGSLKQKTTETNQTLKTNSFTLILMK